MIRWTTLLLFALLTMLLAGCGGDSDVSAAQRITRCLDKQPDATKADCTEWEDAGEVADDGTHEGHDDM